MKYKDEVLSIEEGLKREWIITNGIGGYCSSTIIGANTRKYHGLLVAPLLPPAGRMLILSKLDENIKTNGKSYDLYTNICKNYISDGYKKLKSFEKEYIPEHYGKTVDEKETVFEIGYLIGEEEYLGKGIGKIIVKKLIGEIAEIGGKEILADPDEANVLSIRTLLSNGFVKVKDCDYRYCLK